MAEPGPSLLIHHIGWPWPQQQSCWSLRCALLWCWWNCGNWGTRAAPGRECHRCFSSLNISHFVICLWLLCRVPTWLFLPILFSFIAAFRSEDLPISSPGQSWKPASPHVLYVPYHSSWNTKEQSCLHEPRVISSVQWAFGEVFSNPRDL